MLRLLPALLLLAPLSGCGDSLVSGAALDRLLGLEPFPTEPAWLALWVDEGGEGMLASCSVEPLADELEEEDDDTVIRDQVWVPPPEWLEPIVWTEADDFSWSLALLLLVDTARFDRERAAQALADEELEELAGVWGMADANALLYGEGDIDALGEAIVAGEAPPELDEDGRAWVGFAQEIVVATGTFAGAMTALDPEEQDDLDEFGLPVRRLDSLDTASSALLFGLPFGGLGTTEDCEELLERRRRAAVHEPAPDPPPAAFPGWSPPSPSARTGR